MGFFADLFLGEKCKYCGERDLIDVKCLPQHNMKGCKSCLRVGNYGQIPRCDVCGKPMTGTFENSYGVFLPKCPSCGHKYGA